MDNGSEPVQGFGVDVAEGYEGASEPIEGAIDLFTESDLKPIVYMNVLGTAVFEGDILPLFPSVDFGLGQREHHRDWPDRSVGQMHFLLS